MNIEQEILKILENNYDPDMETMDGFKATNEIAALITKEKKDVAEDVISTMQRIDNETWEWDRGDDSTVAELKEKYGLKNGESHDS